MSGSAADVYLCDKKRLLYKNLYKKLEPGRNITGEIKAQFMARSAEECSVRFVELIRIYDSVTLKISEIKSQSYLVTIVTTR